jgi:hypothetical protein
MRLMTDAFDLAQATIVRSPQDIASWQKTLAITRVQEDPRGGFQLTFDKPVPESWKWPSNPAVPSDNFQFTVWAFARPPSVGSWIGAGFVQMWQGRSMTDGALPAMFTLNGTPAVPGYVNWWGDIRKLWGDMSTYVPKPGDVIGLMVSAGNARLVDGVTSVRERSNVVTFALPASDNLSVRFDGLPTPVKPDPLPVLSNNPADVFTLIKAFSIDVAQLKKQVGQLQSLLILQEADLRDRLDHLTLTGEVKIPRWGTATITLKAVPEK